jgi:ubiquinone/menaquinone biosynthesis C-methylase UbiE
MKHDKLSNHYTGNIAKEYEESRKKGEKWKREQEIVQQFLNQLSSNGSVIDIPVGTGRFFEFYNEKNLKVEGVDISEDMLKEALKHPASKTLNPKLNLGDIFKLNYKDNTFDIAVCIRFLNLIDTEAAREAIEELTRVSSKHLIIGVRHLLPYNEIDICSLKGIKTLTSQTLSKITKKAKGKIIFHSLEDINKTFQTLDLKVLEKKSVDNRADGTAYFIYLLEKTNES